MDYIELLFESGYNKPASKVELCDRVDIVQTVALHKVILSSLAELSQFRNGLSTLGVLDAIKAHSQILSSFFLS